jgi:hypothetical protein
MVFIKSNLKFQAKTIDHKVTGWRKTTRKSRFTIDMQESPWWAMLHNLFDSQTGY